MSSDRDARVLGAGDTITVTKDGKPVKYTVRPVVVRHLCELERAALSHYREQYMETLKQAKEAGLLTREETFAEVTKIAGWGIEDLPQNTAYSGLDIVVTDSLREWVIEKYGGVLSSLADEDGTVTDNTIRAIVVTALDAGEMAEAAIKELTGHVPQKMKVRYDQWWVTAAAEGMVEFVLVAIRYAHPEVTRAEVASWTPPELQEAARTVEAITAASMGNS